METKTSVTVTSDKGKHKKDIKKTTIKTKEGHGHKHGHPGLGGLPSSSVTRDILLETESAIRQTQQHPPAELDSQGRRILSDIEHLTIDERRFIEEKNPDDVFQKFIAEAQLAVKQLQSDMKNVSGIPTSVDRKTADKLGKHANSIVTGCQSLVQELASSGSFRMDVQDLIGYLVTLVEDITGVSVRGLTAPLQSLRPTAGKFKPENVRNAANAAKETVATARSEFKNREPVRPLTDQERCLLLDHISWVLYDLSSKEETRKILRGMIDMAQLFADGFAINRNMKEAKDTMTKNDHLVHMIKYLRIFLSRFTGQAVMDKLVHHVKELGELSFQDRDVKKFFVGIRELLLTRIDKPLEDPESIRCELETLVEQGRKISNTKDFGYHMGKSMKYLSKAWLGITNDPQLMQYQRDIRQLITDLTFDENGNFSLNANALQQLRIILVSTLVEKMTIFIPPISQNTEKMDFEVSNIHLELKDIIPEEVKFAYKGHMNMNTRDLKNVSVHEGNRIKISINNVKFSMHNLHVWWNRKSFPKSEDSGKMDIDMPGDGLDIKIILNVKMKDENLFTVQSVNARIDKLKLKLADSKHDFIYNSFLKLGSGAIKKRIETALRERITKVLERLNLEISRQVKRSMRMATSRMSTGINQMGSRVFNPDKGLLRVGQPMDVSHGKKKGIQVTRERRAEK